MHDQKNIKLFLNRFSPQNIKISNFEKTRPVAVELFHAHELTDRQTDMTKLIVAIRNFTKGPKNGLQTVNDKATYNNIFWSISSVQMSS